MSIVQILLETGHINYTILTNERICIHVQDTGSHDYKSGERSRESSSRR